jgi:hypothetical protein
MARTNQLYRHTENSGNPFERFTPEIIQELVDLYDKAVTIDIPCRNGGVIARNIAERGSDSLKQAFKSMLTKISLRDFVNTDTGGKWVGTLRLHINGCDLSSVFGLAPVRLKPEKHHFANFLATSCGSLMLPN